MMRKADNLYLQVDLRYSDLKDTFVKGISLMNLVEVFINYIVLAIHESVGDVSQHCHFDDAKQQQKWIGSTACLHGEHNDFI
ncbi:hypothetical protein AWC38_SpisGene20202 [Stylophora pistillata]|uniref:Uncharacterized protein n=1 Tax=Stylophora pistillata TaxID=50429 RepID=A0A2B4RGG6_STYPI|nr:hypothetical protein AWC38_SpisGene20202 [Stylophora pistillata]